MDRVPPHHIKKLGGPKEVPTHIGQLIKARMGQTVGRQRPLIKRIMDQTLQSSYLRKKQAPQDHIHRSPTENPMIDDANHDLEDKEG